jgi:hypothetical protein
VELTVPAIPATFTMSPIGINGTVSVVVNDNLALTSEETGGAVPDGTYDWIEVLGSTAIGICLLPGGICEPDEYSPADGEERSVALIGDSRWISWQPDSRRPAAFVRRVGDGLRVR